MVSQSADQSKIDLDLNVLRQVLPLLKHFRTRMLGAVNISFFFFSKGGWKHTLDYKGMEVEKCEEGSRVRKKVGGLLEKIQLGRRRATIA